MTNHPITPPPELVQQWLSEHFGYGLSMYESSAMVTYTDITAKAAQWGADQELEACCEWFLKDGWNPEHPTNLRAARRPKPPSLKEQALEALDQADKGLNESEWQQRSDTIRRALESLPA